MHAIADAAFQYSLSESRLFNSATQRIARRVAQCKFQYSLSESRLFNLFRLTKSPHGQFQDSLSESRLFNPIRAGGRYC